MVRRLDAALVGVALALATVVALRTMERVADRDGSRPAEVATPDPLDPAALARRALDLERRGEAVRADAVFTFAGERGWRDWQVQNRLLARAVQAGDWTAAMSHADALLRTDDTGTLSPAVFRLIDALDLDPAARPAVVRSLAARPPWRPRYLQHLGQVGAAEDPRGDDLFVALAHGPAPAGPAEYGPYVRALIARGAYDRAYGLWRRLAPRPDAGLPLRDGDFDRAEDGTPFTWASASGVGAASEVAAPGPAGAGMALHVVYDGFSSPALPAQLLVLRPGPHRVTWLERRDGPPRMTWRVRCPGGAILATAEASTPERGWRARALDVQVPDHACPAQWLELIPLPGERRETEEGWFGRFRVVGGA